MTNYDNAPISHLITLADEEFTRVECHRPSQTLSTGGLTGVMPRFAVLLPTRRPLFVRVVGDLKPNPDPQVKHQTYITEEVVLYRYHGPYCYCYCYHYRYSYHYPTCEPNLKLY